MLRPWKKEFNRPLDDLAQSWGATVSDIESTESRDQRGFPISSFVYPTARLKRHNREFEITVSEFPTGSVTFFEADDNMEYLNLTGLTTCADLDFILRPMEFVTRFLAKLGHRRGTVTGEPKIDSRHQVFAENRASGQLLARPAVQQGILKVIPFSGLRANGSSLTHSTLLNSKDQLTFEHLDPMLMNLAALAIELERT